MIKDNGKELFLKRAALWVSTIALALTFLMGPVAFFLKSAVRAVLREELVRYDAYAPAARAKTHQDYANDVLKSMGQDYLATRANTSALETGLLGLSNRLFSIEGRLDLALKEQRREEKPQVTRTKP